MPESVHEFEELWVEDGEHSAASSGEEHADTTPTKAVDAHPEASDNSEATSKSTNDPSDTPTTRQGAVF